MKTLGTLLPTAKSLAANDAWHAEATASAARHAESALAGISPVVEQGETRYYKTATVYAVVKLGSNRVLWFERRKDGDYSIPAPISNIAKGLGAKPKSNSDHRKAMRAAVRSRPRP